MNNYKAIILSLIMIITITGCTPKVLPVSETAEDSGFVLTANISNTGQVIIGDKIEVSTRLLNTNTITYDVADDGKNIYIDFYKETDQPVTSLPARIYQIAPNQEFTQNKTITIDAKGKYILDIYSTFSVRDPLTGESKDLSLKINQKKYEVK